MNILLCNDDGIDSPGLIQLLEQLSTIANVYVVAPESEKSAYSHKLTISGRIKLEERQLEHAKKAYALYGSPADCVYSALTFLIDEKIDLVISGINRGPNVSTDIIYSGTVAAAREGFLSGYKAMAVSLCNFYPNNYYEASIITSQIAMKYLKLDKDDYFLNVNIPDLKKEDIKGIKICDNIAKVVYEDVYSFTKRDEKDYISIGFGSRSIEGDNDDLSIDTNAIEAGYISISPLHNSHISKKHVKDVKKLIK